MSEPFNVLNRQFFLFVFLPLWLNKEHTILCL